MGSGSSGALSQAVHYHAPPYSARALGDVTAVGSLVLMVAASLGAGAALLHAIGVLATLRASERLAWSFGLGIGVLGWAVFPIGIAGLISPAGLLLLCLPFTAGVLFLREQSPQERWQPDIATYLLAAAIFAVGLGDVLEAVSPAADADSMAYHFAIPRLFLESGRIVFIPRASDGAAPLLPQMTYLVALGMGGELSLTLWCMITAWSSAFLSYAVSRRYLGRNWALLVALVVLSMPAMLYGGGTGQVETRTMIFVVIAAIAVADALATGNTAFAAVAGVSAGFFMASKYPGLIYAFSCGCVLLAQRRWLRHGIVFSAASALAGGEWYLWNFWHTGDPVFPLLFGIVEYLPGVPWNAVQAAFMREHNFAGELGLPRNLLWFFAYPFVATVTDNPAFDSGRVGFGPYPLLLLPFVAAAFIRRGRGVLGDPLLPLAAICLLFYAIWFSIGPSQRLRHLFPVVPLLVIGLTVAAEWVTRERPERAALIAAAVATSLIQVAGQIVVVGKFLPYALGVESREEFLRRNVSYYDLAAWINTHMKPADRVLLIHRQLNYLVLVPIFYGHVAVEARVEMRPDQSDVRVFWAQLLQQRITHATVDAHEAIPGAPRGHSGYTWLLGELVNLGCAEVIASVPVRGIRSRTLPTLSKEETASAAVDVLRLRRDRCPQ